MKTKLNNKKGTIIVVFSYFVVFILLPLLAVGYDLAMMQVFKMHLDNIAQLSALSCQPHAGNTFHDESCHKAMAKIAALNLNIDRVKNAIGLPEQAGYADHGSTESNRTALGHPNVTADKDMQTKVFRLENEKFFSVQGGASTLDRIIDSGGGINNLPTNLGEAEKVFSFERRVGTHSINSFSIKGKYKPLFVKFLGKINPKYKDGIEIESSPITVRAVIDHPSS